MSFPVPPSAPLNGPTLSPDYGKYPILIYSDLATVVAAAVESQIYLNKIDWKSCGIYGLVGIVSSKSLSRTKIRLNAFLVMTIVSKRIN